MTKKSSSKKTKTRRNRKTKTSSNRLKELIETFIKNRRRNKSLPKKVRKSKRTQIEKENNKEKKKVKKVKFKHKHPVIAWIIRIILLLILIVTVIGAGIAIGIIFGAFGDDFEISEEDLILDNLSSNSVIVDQEGNVLVELSGEGNRKIISINEMSPHLVDAYVAIEDERFYEHQGVDLYRTAGAIVTYVTHGGKSSFGGSTITQQLVKNITQDKEKSGIEGMLRKIKEWAKAYQVEKMLSKQQILELYLNLIFVGGGDNHGVQTAAKYYFNKNASELSLVECAFLAGINSNPNAYNPFGEYGYSTYEAKKDKINTKTKVVLNKMLQTGKINQEECDTAKKEIDENGIQFSEGKTSVVYSYHTDALINQAIEDIMKEKGVTKQLAEVYLYSSGLTIYSTESKEVQAAAEQAMKDALIIHSKKNKDQDGNGVTNQAAIVIIDHKTGYVLGCVGGVGEKTARGLNRATQSVRQPGSTIKPIADVIPALNEKIITAATMYNDSPTTFKTAGRNYSPKDYNTPRGVITVRDAITTSQNIPFVKIMTELGVSRSIDYLEKMGITSLSRENEGLALSIGGIYRGISPLEMAGAYATIANNGVYIEPTFYTKILDKDGNVVLTPEQKTERAFSEDTAAIMKSILKSVTSAGGTAPRCAIHGIDTAAKTGTTNEDKDRWLCGFTNYYTAAVWYGYDDPETVTYNIGISPAVLIWANAMKPIHQNLPNSRFTLTNNIVSAKICKKSGKLASDSCTETYTEYFIKGTIPQSCEGHVGVEVCKQSHLLANEYCPEKEIVYKEYVVEKEKTGNWSTPANGKENEIPTEKCTTHKAPEKFDIPNVVGKTEAEAKKILEDAGFAVKTQADKDSDKDKGIVSGMTPNSGAKAEKGTTIVLKISTGEKKKETPEKFNIPNVVGKTEAEAKKILEDAGFTVKTQADKDSDKDKGIVSGMTPNSGTKAEKGTTIVIKVSTGEKKTESPSTPTNPTTPTGTDTTKTDATKSDETKSDAEKTEN